MVSRRARWTACSDGQRSRNAAKTSVSLSRNHYDLREVLLEREGQSVRDADAVLHQVTPCLDETSQRPHVLTLALEGCKPLWMTEKEVESQRCVRRVVFRAARNERATVLG